MSNDAMSTSAINKSVLIPILMFQVALGCLLTDLYVPAMPQMVTDFHTTSTMVQYTLTFYLCGYSIMQFFYGPLSDKYGRRPVIIFGSAVAALGLYLSVIPHESIHLLIAARILQGAGMAACVSLARAMISDCYEGKAFARISSYLSLVIGVFPAIAPFLGGQITHFFSWQMNFDIMAVLGTVALILILFCLQETNLHKKDKLEVFADYGHLLTHKHFYCYMLISGLSYATVMVYVMMLPFIAYHDWHMTPSTYGYLALVISFSMMVGKLFNVFLLRYLDVRGMICLGLFLMLVCSLWMGGVAYFTKATMLALVVPLICALTGAGMIFPNASSTVYGPFRHIAGSTSALYGGGQVLVAFIAQGVAASATENHLASLCWTFVCLAVLANVAFYTLSAKSDNDPE